MLFTDRLRRFERIEVIPKWQHDSLMQCRKEESLTRRSSSLLDGVTVRIYVAGRQDCDSYCGDTFPAVFRAQEVFGEGQMDVGKIYGRHDARNRRVQELVHSGKWQGLVSCMVEVLVVAAEELYRDPTTDSLRVMIWCESGRCPSFSAALWMARVSLVLNLQFEVHFQRWNDRNVADKRCDCGDCTTPVGLHRYLLLEAEKVSDKLAEVAVHGSVYAICDSEWRKCSFHGDERMCRRVRESAGNMLRAVVHLQTWCAAGSNDSDVLEIRNAPTW